VQSSIPECDVTLPRGSTDIHLFAVTAVNAGNVESEWPPLHTHLRAFMAPRIKAPAAPSLTSSFVGNGGGAQLRLDALTYSEVPVHRFLFLRTRSEVAARSAETMGPPFAEVVAAVTTDPPTPTGALRYTASWTGPVAESWEPTRYRAVAIPVAEVPVEATRGVPSPGSPQVPVQVPPSTPPDLELLTAEEWGGDPLGIVVRTATRAPIAPTAFGPHVLHISILPAGGGAPLFPDTQAGLHELAEATDPGAPPSGADTAPVVVRSATAGGVTPLGLWFKRGAPGDSVRVRVRLVDPLGHVTDRTIDVPPHTDEAPPSLDVIDFFRITGRGVVVRFASDAPVAPAPEGSHVLQVEARRPGLPLLGPMVRPVELSIVVPDIPVMDSRHPFPAGDSIMVRRTSDVSPYEYIALVRMTPPLGIALQMIGPTGASTTRSIRVTM
jgi:hypothetical protein